MKEENKLVYTEDQVDRDGRYDKDEVKEWHERNGSRSSAGSFECVIPIVVDVHPDAEDGASSSNRNSAFFSMKESKSHHC